MKEKWRVIKDYRDYEVSNKGRIRSWKKRGNGGGRVDKPVLFSRSGIVGYVSVKLHDKQRVHSAFVHRLVLEAFVGHCPKGMEARHRDGVSSHNDVGNLCWGTHVENMADRDRHGTTAHNVGGGVKGKDNVNAVHVSDDVVVEIQKRFDENESVCSIARDLDLGRCVVTAVVKGTHWTQRPQNPVKSKALTKV